MPGQLYVLNIPKYVVYIPNLDQPADKDDNGKGNQGLSVLSGDKGDKGGGGDGMVNDAEVPLLGDAGRRRRGSASRKKKTTTTTTAQGKKKAKSMKVARKKTKANVRRKSSGRRGARAAGGKTVEEDEDDPYDVPVVIEPEEDDDEEEEEEEEDGEEYGVEEGDDERQEDASSSSSSSDDSSDDSDEDDEDEQADEVQAGPLAASGSRSRSRSRSHMLSAAFGRALGSSSAAEENQGRLNPASTTRITPEMASAMLATSVEMVEAAPRSTTPPPQQPTNLISMFEEPTPVQEPQEAQTAPAAGAPATDLMDLFDPPPVAETPEETAATARDAALDPPELVPVDDEDDDEEEAKQEDDGDAAAKKPKKKRKKKEGKKKKTKKSNHLSARAKSGMLPRRGSKTGRKASGLPRSSPPPSRQPSFGLVSGGIDKTGDLQMSGAGGGVSGLGGFESRHDEWEQSSSGESAELDLSDDTPEEEVEEDGDTTDEDFRMLLSLSGVPLVDGTLDEALDRLERDFDRPQENTEPVPPEGAAVVVPDGVSLTEQQIALVRSMRRRRRARAARREAEARARQRRRRRRRQQRQRYEQRHVRRPLARGEVRIHMLNRVRALLAHFAIDNVVIVRDEFSKSKRSIRKAGSSGMQVFGGEKRYMITFVTVDSDEAILRRLVEMGIGTDFGTLSVTELEVARVHQSAERKRQLRMIEKRRQEEQGGAGLAFFRDTIRARLLLDRVVEQTKAAAQFSFDFFSLIVVASMLAMVGLVTNNSVIIVASMLVSPLMGPILALTFGTVIKDWELTKTGLRNECIALLMCILVGFVTAIPFIPYGTALNWPTPEMESRGFASGLVVGLAIAIPSGVGVALSILGNNTASLVGVAISAALLPPAVNTGICFAYAIIGNSLDVRDGDPVDRARFAEIGSISFGLTIMNIMCIYIVAIFMFKLKEVAPISRNEAFWDFHKTQANYAQRMDENEAETLATQVRNQNLVRNANPALSANPELWRQFQMLGEGSALDVHNVRFMNERKYKIDGRHLRTLVAGAEVPVAHNAQDAQASALDGAAAPAPRRHIWDVFPEVNKPEPGQDGIGAGAGAAASAAAAPEYDNGDGGLRKRGGAGLHLNAM